ncbi:MAG TPA: hypothetical protein PKC14_00660 [Candidatus Absconditabacterales bacterium]|nr:hypothetical protein [Candidatus Absconditabacterales bacterium]
MSETYYEGEYPKTQIPKTSKTQILERFQDKEFRSRLMDPEKKAELEKELEDLKGDINKELGDFLQEEINKKIENLTPTQKEELKNASAPQAVTDQSLKALFGAMYFLERKKDETVNLSFEKVKENILSKIGENKNGGIEVDSTTWGRKMPSIVKSDTLPADIKSNTPGETEEVDPYAGDKYESMIEEIKGKSYSLVDLFGNDEKAKEKYSKFFDGFKSYIPLPRNTSNPGEIGFEASTMKTIDQNGEKFLQFTLDERGKNRESFKDIKIKLADIMTDKSFDEAKFKEKLKAIVENLVV